MKEKQYYDIVAAIYDAALDPSNWHHVFHKLERLFHAEKILMGVTKNSPGSASFDLNLSHNFESAFLRSYNDYYHKLNVTLDEGIRRGLLRSGYIYCVGDLCEDLTPAQNRMYQEVLEDWAEPQGVECSFGTCLVLDKDFFGLLTIGRNGRHGRATEEEVDILRRLTPHFQRAVSQYKYFSKKRDSMEAALSLVGVGVVVLDSEQCVVFINEEAERIISMNDGVRITAKGSLRVHDSRLQRRFNANMNEAVKTSELCSTSPGDAFKLSRPSEKKPYSLMISPIGRGIYDGLSASSKCLVLIHDPEREPPQATIRLQQLYGLTEAESEVVDLLAAGFSIDEISDILKVTRNTSRTLLQRAFQKTETHRQAEIVALVRGDNIIFSN